MSREIILRKTPRGRAEVQTREHGLSTLARRILILVDGRNSVAQLAADLALDPDDPDFGRALRELYDGAYVWEADERDRSGAGGSPRRGWHALR